MHPVVGKLRLKAFRQLFDIGVDHGRSGRLFHLFHGDIFPAVDKIFIDCPVEKPCVLQYHGVGAAQTVPFDIVGVLSVQQDTALADVIEPHQKVDDRRFSCTGRPHYGDLLSRFRMQIKFLQDLLLRLIAERNIPQDHIPVNLLQHPRLLPVRPLRQLVHQPEYPLRRRKSRLEFPDDIGSLIDRPRELTGILDERGDIPDPDAAPQIQQRTEDADQRQRRVIHKVHGRTGQRSVVLRPGIGLHRLLILPVKNFDYLLLPAIGPDRLLPVDHLLHHAV